MLLALWGGRPYDARMHTAGARTVGRRGFRATALAAGLAALVMGCETSDVDVVREAGISVAGRYRDPEGGNLVTNSSGASVRVLDLTQGGVRLEGVDNNGVRFGGRIGRVSGQTAWVELTGTTTAGAAFTLTGTITVDSTTATLRATWVEADRQGGVFGTARVAGVVPPPDVNDD